MYKRGLNFRAKVGSFIGENNPMFGKPQSDLCKFINSNKRLGKSYEEIMGDEMATLLKEKRKQQALMANPFKGKKHTEETKLKISQANKGKKGWNKGLTRITDERINKAFINKKPTKFVVKKNKLEEDFDIILEENFPNKWKYAGTGEMPIGYKFPDFVNENEKKIIEVFGTYWHRNDTGEDRTILFKQYGYSTLIIWEREIREDLLNVLEKVSNF